MALDDIRRKDGYSPGGQMRCPSCRSENPEGLNFCTECGAAFKNACGSCGFQNVLAAKFCGKCGSGLESTSTPSAKVYPPASPMTPGVRCVSEAFETQASPDGERKTVTALFADIKGSTELTADLDPEEARAIIDPALKLMIDAVRRYDGYVVQSTGDGIFALFGAPLAHEDHPQRALYAALRMQEELKRYSDRIRQEGRFPLQARVGANTGEVVVRTISTGGAKTEYTPIGHTTNLASRIQALAPIGSIAVAEETRKLCEGYFTLRSLGPTRIKGLGEPVNVYEVTGLGPLRTRLQRAVGRGLTKFVGRDREMEAMRHAADQAKSGHGQIIAVMAEPGVGKSRLFFEFMATSQSGWMVLETFSVSHGKASAYLPVLALLHGYFDIKSEDDARKRREKVAGKITILDRSLEDTLPYLFALLGIVEAEDALGQMDAQVKKRRTLDAIKRILLRESLNLPLIVMFEDLHWIDEQTQELLNLLADSIGTAKILLLVNYRPEYTHQWNSKTYYTQLRLDSLGKESAEEMLATLLGAGDDLAALKRLIIERTEGNPFFMEEIYQALIEQGALVGNGTVKLAKSINAVKVPATVQAVIAARIDRLPAEQKELLQTLAVLGRQFPFGLVCRVTLKPDDDLNQMLSDLQLAEFIYEQPATGDVEYTFKHALTQEVASYSLLTERRKLLHERTAMALESMFAGQLEDHLVELAHHYGRSANDGKAVEYLARAGQQALDRSAYVEAQTQLQQGLDRIKKLPVSPGREARELELASTLAQILLVRRGYRAPEALAAGERARQLAEKNGNLAQLVVQVFGDLQGVFVAGDYATAWQMSDRLLDLAQREGGQTSLAFVYQAKGDISFVRGDLARAEENFTRLSSFLDLPPVGQLPRAMSAMAVASLCAWVSGYADQARERITRVIAFVLDSNNALELGNVRYLESTLFLLLREPQHAEIAAAQALTIAEEQGFPFVRDFARTTHGCALARLGRVGEGIALIREGLVGMAEAGVRAAITGFCTWMAEAQALDGKIDDALITIEGVLKEKPEELYYRPETLRIRGDLRLQLGQTELADADFHEAIALAQKMQAKSWELRATTSLARLLVSQGHRNEARVMLAEIYGWFTEGFDTADLKDAKALLEELSE
jgi:class 3 adenylate cyclase/tetratricopeptide (TPR) repeat protein